MVVPEGAGVSDVQFAVDTCGLRVAGSARFGCLGMRDRLCGWGLIPEP